MLAAGYTLTLVTAEETFAVSIRAFLVRFLANGNADPSFAPAIANATDGESYWFYGWHFYPPSALAVQPDGQILLGGVFNSLNGTNRNGIARLNSNGTVDNSFVPATASYVRVSALALQADGKVLAGGGYFGTVNGTNTYGITRFHANGSYDAAFNTGTGTGGGSQVVSVALQPDGKVLIAGSFTNFNGTSRNGLARLNANGSLDGGFNPGAGAKGISSIALQSDGRILIGGGFLTYNGVLRPFVARLLGDSPWPVLSPARSGGSLSLTWPMTALNFQLQESTNLALASAWSPVAQTPVTDGPQQSVSVSTGGERKFFRLESQ